MQEPLSDKSKQEEKLYFMTLHQKWGFNDKVSSHLRCLGITIAENFIFRSIPPCLGSNTQIKINVTRSDIIMSKTLLSIIPSRAMCVVFTTAFKMLRKSVVVVNIYYYTVLATYSSNT